MKKTKKTKKTTLVIMDHFIETINEIYKMFEDSNESITSIYIKQDLSDSHYLKASDLEINTEEDVDGGTIYREHRFINDVIHKDYLDMVYFRKAIKEEVA